MSIVRIFHGVCLCAAVAAGCAEAGPIRERVAFVPPIYFPAESGHAEMPDSAAIRTSVSPVKTWIHPSDAKPSGRVYVAGRMGEIGPRFTWHSRWSFGFALHHSLASSGTRSEPTILALDADGTVAGFGVNGTYRREMRFVGFSFDLELPNIAIPYSQYEMRDSLFQFQDNGSDSLWLPGIGVSVHGHVGFLKPFLGARVLTVARAGADEIHGSGAGALALGWEYRPLHSLGFTALVYRPINDGRVNQGPGLAVGVRFEKEVDYGGAKEVPGSADGLSRP